MWSLSFRAPIDRSSLCPLWRALRVRKQRAKAAKPEHHDRGLVRRLGAHVAGWRRSRIRPAASNATYVQGFFYFAGFPQADLSGVDRVSRRQPLVAGLIGRAIRMRLLPQVEKLGCDCLRSWRVSYQLHRIPLSSESFRYSAYKY